MKNTLTARIFFLFLLLGIACGDLFAEVTIQTQLEKNVLRVGEQTRLQVQVSTEGEEISNTPSMPSIDGVNFVYTGAPQVSKSFQIINGRASSKVQVTFNYDVIAVKQGKYPVNGVGIGTDKGNITAKPFEITVFPSAKPLPTLSPLLSSPSNQGNLNMYLLCDTTKKEVYEGEEVILSYDGVYHQQWKRWFDRAIVQKGEYAAFEEEKGALKNFLAESVDMRFKRDSRPVRVAGSRDMYYQKSLRRFILYPLTPGEYSLIPMTVQFALPIQRVTKYPFKPEAINLVVKPLPEEGKPDIFEGAVGQFTIRAKADPSEVTEGDTVTLRVTLEGIGNIKNAPKPKLPDLSKFDQFDPTQQENVDVTESGMRGRIEYSYVLIPHDVNANEIGPVRYAFFDPAQKKYQIRETPPIPLTILPSAGKSARTGSGVAFNRRLITWVGDDFRFIATAPAGISRIVLPVHRLIKFWCFAVLPVLLFLLACVWKWRHEFLAARPTVAKSIKAPKLARRLLENARKALDQQEMELVYVNLGKAITDYIDNRWDMACAGMTSLELRESLLQCGVEDGKSDLVVSMLEDFDSARFSGAAQDNHRVQDDFAKTEALLAELMKVKKG